MKISVNQPNTCDGVNLPCGPFAAILADPPWNFRTYSAKGRDRCPDARHYDVMSLDDIKNMPVADIAAKDCALFLWVTDPMLQEGIDVMKSWGFTYKTIGFTWAKTNRVSEGWAIGTGYWTRANPEMCLMGTRGKPQRQSCSVRQLVVEPRREHSRKPDCVRSRIEELVPGPYCELFARTESPGWSSWGNQTERFAA